MCFLPRPPKGSKKWNPLRIPLFPQCSNGFILGGFHFLDTLGGLGLYLASPVQLLLEQLALGCIVSLIARVPKKYKFSGPNSKYLVLATWILNLKPCIPLQLPIFPLKGTQSLNTWTPVICRLCPGSRVGVPSIIGSKDPIAPTCCPGPHEPLVLKNQCSISLDSSVLTRQSKHA